MVIIDIYTYGRMGWLFMDCQKKRVLVWEIVGVLIILGISSLLHFCFEWSGNFKPLAVFCAVNGSTWEHLKIGFWGAAFYSLIEYFVFLKRNKNFVFAKTLSFYLIVILTALFAFIFRDLFKIEMLAVDILYFTAAIFIAQLISYKILISHSNYRVYRPFALIALVIIIAAFSLLTYFPVEIGIFKDPVEGGYGL